MTSVTSDARGETADVDHLRSLPSFMLREGYVDAYCVFGALHQRFDDVRSRLNDLPDHLRALFRLFFLAETVDQARVAEAVPEDLLAALVRLGVVLDHRGGYSTGGLTLLPLFGLMMFVPAPSVNPLAYFGDDSTALAVRLHPRRGARCLDLCAGPGIQALRSSVGGGPVVAVEINPVAAACAELNVEMNGLGDRIEVRRGDLFDAVRPDETFDLITANPPLLPFPPELPYPFVGHGGAAGLAVTWKILAGLPQHLAAGGTAQIIGTCLGDDAGPFPEAPLSRWADASQMQIAMTVPSRVDLRPGAPYFKTLALTCATAAQLRQEDVEERLGAFVEEQGARWLYLFYLAVSAGSPHPGLTMTRHFESPGGFWFR